MASPFLSAERRLSCPWRVDPFFTEAQGWPIGHERMPYGIHSKNYEAKDALVCGIRQVGLLLAGVVAGAQELRRRFSVGRLLFCSLEYGFVLPLSERSRVQATRDDLRQRTSLYMKMAIASSLSKI